MKSVVERFVPETWAWKVTDPVLSWACSKCSDETETYAYQGRGAVEYVGETDERTLGEFQATLGMIPFTFGIIPAMLYVGLVPNGLYGLPIALAIAAFLLMGLTVMDKVEVERAGGEKA